MFKSMHNSLNEHKHNFKVLELAVSLASAMTGFYSIELYNTF